MGSRLLLLLVLLQWIHSGCWAQGLPREELLSWFGGRLLEGLGLDGPPEVSAQVPDRRRTQRERTRLLQQRVKRTRHQSSENQETSEMILFPRTGSSCVRPKSTNHELTFHFRPSLKNQEVKVTSACFWFHAGKGANASAPLFVLMPSQQRLQVADAPSHRSSDGWKTFDLSGALLTSVAQGPFTLRVHCPIFEHHIDNTPFLALRTRARAPVRSRRHTLLHIPWSPAAIDLLQRPPQERAEHGDCQREHVEISFQELGWDNWIVHPATLTFYYCHGNCTAQGRISAALGMSQCCAPVPGSLRSLRITTTSDGGYSFKYETLPNIIPEACTCI